MHPDLARFGDKIDGLVNQVKRGVALELFATLIGPPPEGTPVKQGVARGSWNYAVNRIDTSIPERPPKGQELAAPIPGGVGANVQLGDEINISNSAPYIARLNEGSSKQTPAGFVEMATDRAVGTFEGMVEQIKGIEG